jgi:hypothetical protein
VLRSKDGGATWLAVQAPMPASITAMSSTADGQLIAANQAGFVMALRGDRLEPLHPAPLPPLNGLLVRPNAPALALSVQGALSVPKAQGNPK